MSKFSKRSNANLAECHIDLQIIADHVIKIYDFSVIEGSRGKELQNLYFHSGTSRVPWPKSKHNITKDRPLSEASDWAPYPIRWMDKERFIYFAGVVKGIAEMLLEQGKISHRIRWGGDWDSDNDLSDQNYRDLVHFELCPV